MIATGRINVMLSLMDKLMLISINPDKNKMWPLSLYIIQYGLKGAVILQLADMKKIKVDKQCIEVIDQSSTGIEILDNILRAMKKAKRPVKLRTWVSGWTKYNKMLRDTAIYNLENNGMIRVEKDRILGIFSRKRYIVDNLYEHQKLIEGIRNAILNENMKKSDDITYLGALMIVCGTYHALFSREERKKIRKFISLVKKGDIFTEHNPLLKEVIAAVKYAISEQQSAAVVAANVQS